MKQSAKPNFNLLSFSLSLLCCSLSPRLTFWKQICSVRPTTCTTHQLSSLGNCLSHPIVVCVRALPMLISDVILLPFPTRYYTLSLSLFPLSLLFSICSEILPHVLYDTVKVCPSKQKLNKPIQPIRCYPTNEPPNKTKQKNPHPHQWQLYVCVSVVVNEESEWDF